MPKKEPDEPKSESPESKSDSEPSETTSKVEASTEEKPKEGTPEYKAWKGRLISEGKRKAKEEREMAEEKKDEPIPEGTMAPKTEETKSETKPEKKDSDLGGLAVGLVLGALFLFLLWFVLKNRKKEAAIDTAAEPVHQMEEKTEVAVKTVELQPAGSGPLLQEDNPFNSVLGPGGKLKSGGDGWLGP